METGKVMRALAGVSSSRRLRRGVRATLAVAALLPALPAAAQPVCADGRIAFVFIDTRAIFDADDPALDMRVQWAYRAANALHFDTRETTVRRELLFTPGDCYDAFLLAESERLLRNLGVFARVDVFGVPQPDGSWHVIVATRDEWSTQLDVKVRFDNGIGIEGARLFETNLMGRARTLGVFYYEREVTRDYGLVYATPHLFRSRWDGMLGIGRTRAGNFVRSELAYPFLGEVGQYAGRLSWRRDQQFFDYVLRDDDALISPHVLMPVKDEFIDASMVRRFGERGSTLLLGAALTLEELDYPGVVEVAPEGNFDDRVEADPAQKAAVLPQQQLRDQLRASLLVGHQNIVWVKRRGYDSMRGEQDVRIGSEVGLVVGRTLSAHDDDHDTFLGGTGYAGFSALGGFMVLRARSDARWDIASPGDPGHWEDVFLDAELLAYFRRPTLPRHTLVVRWNAAGAWNTTTPFQLTLGGERALRGYDQERFPGGNRVVLSLEDRIYLGWPWPDLFDTGLTLFADVGRIWPGDAPFGADSGWRSSAGIGIRSSFPEGGRTTYRLDLAWPVGAGTQLKDLRIRISVGEILGMAQREVDPQIARSRAESIGGRLFDVRFR